MRNNYYKYRNKRKKYYYHHKPFYYHKSLLKRREENILLQEKQDSDIELENENNTEQIELVPEKQEEVVLPKLPIIRIALGIVIVAALVFGIAYSYFNFYKEVSKQADVSSGEAYVRVPESKANITLTKVYPRTNTEARSRNDNYVDFTINAKNTSTKKILSYQIDINDGTPVANKARISRDYIKVDLQEKISGVYTYVQEAVSLSEFTFEGVVPVNTTSEVTREFRLRIWVSDEVLISDTESGATYTQAEFANLYANYSITVRSWDDNPPIPTIDSCEGCKFIYTTTKFNYGGASGTEVSALSGVTQDYRTLNKNYFLGFTESNGKVDRAFACGIKGEDPNNGTAFCIEGSADDSKFTTNRDLITGTTLWDDSDLTTRCDEEGYNINCYGLVDALISQEGLVEVAEDFGSCDVGNDGSAHCYVW